MTGKYKYHKIPRSRISTFDVYSVGMRRHHVSALLELDVTESRGRLRELKRKGSRISFTAWIIKVISKAVKDHPEVAGFLINKKKLITFDDVNISIVVEKQSGDKYVPIPLLIEKANVRSIPEITRAIAEARNKAILKGDIVLNHPSGSYERLYFRLPGILRRAVWKFLLRHPEIAYKKMGNVVITSLSATGRINGWFIHKTVHPLSFGVGSIVKKPKVVDKEIKIREILNMTVLLDHDVVDGAPMMRFLNDLTRYIEAGYGLPMHEHATNIARDPVRH
jgi:pyruvate/2-oxoglutarate dehydrogenase complex dihydrolipoamide acyltransferase (E2) component